jgi:hypothetical protein
MKIKDFNMEMNIINFLKLLVCSAIIINIFTKISNQIFVNNVFIILFILIILGSMYFDLQLGFLLLLLLISIIYTNSLKYVRFNLNPSIWYYDRDSAIENYENNKVSTNNEYNLSVNKMNDISDNKNKSNKFIDYDPEQNDNDDDNNNNNNNDNNNDSDDDDDKMNNDNNDDDDNNNDDKANEDMIENFEEPVDIKLKLKELEQQQQQQIKSNVPINVKTENVDLDNFISNSIYVPFEKLDAIQNNMITTVPTDTTQLDSSIPEDYPNKITNNRELFVEKYIN